MEQILGDLHLQPERPGDRLQNPKTRGDNLRADPITTEC
jgi:hypothetical protein